MPNRKCPARTKEDRGIAGEEIKVRALIGATAFVVRLPKECYLIIEI